MRIATYNINGINKRLPTLLAWLDQTRPDAVCLQELKAETPAFPEAALSRAGYHATWVGQRSWNGVAILARGTPPVTTRTTLPGDPASLSGDDHQARYIEAAVHGILIGCLYAPNGNPISVEGRTGPKFAYKLAWTERLIAHAATLHAANIPAVLAGDYNIVPTPSDIYNERSWRTNALLQPEPRAQFARLLAAGWTDPLAATRPYTFWSSFRDSVARDAGMRIDHLLLSPAAAARLESSGVDRTERPKPGASDHAPAWITLRAKPRRSRPAPAKPAPPKPAPPTKDAPP